MKHVVGFSHQLLQETVNPGDIVIDATCGNGNDTLFLSTLVGDKGRVLAFDIQKQAIDATRKKLTDNQITNSCLVQDSHEHVGQYLKNSEQIGGAVFNLGYLPGSGDKSIITKGEKTVDALSIMLAFLRKRGVIVLVIYHGHAGGTEEKKTVLDFVTSLDQHLFDVLQYGFINQRNAPPFVVAIEKK